MAEEGANRLLHVQGLRGAAMLTIVLYHCDLPPSGGFVALDSFFVISGYVIAGMLLREKRAHGRIRFAEFYLRRIRRLVPLLAVTIVATVLLSAVVESPLRAQQTTGRVGAFATVSLANVALYRTGTGYFDQAAETIPLRHTWSLSVEEQFYLFFPLLMAMLLAGRRPRLWAVSAGIAVAGLASYVALAVSAQVDELPFVADPRSFAYYSPVTRLWEMAFGVGLAVWHLSRPPLSAGTARWVGWGGAVALVGSVVLFTSEVGSSNPILLVPVLGSAMILMSGRTPGLLSRALSWRPLCWVGDRSYGWYLWHWPLIVFAVDLWGDSRLVMISASLVGLAASTVTYPLVEQRFRYPRRDQPRRQQLRGAVRLAAGCVLVSAGLSVGLHQAASRHWGSTEIRTMAAQVAPRPINLGTGGCAMDEVLRSDTVAPCTVGTGTGVPVYLLGDSNGGQFGVGLLAAAEELNRPVVLLWRAGCAFTDVSVVRPDYDVEGCDTHNAQVLQWLERAPDATVIVANGGEYIGATDVALRAPGGEEADSARTKAPVYEQGQQRVLTALRASTGRVVMLRMLPHPGGVDEQGRARWSALHCGLGEILLVPDGCGESASLAAEDRRQEAELDAEATAAEAADVEYLDLRATICPDGRCDVRRGDQWIYRDAAHITNDTSRSLAPFFAGLLSADSP